MSHNFESMNPWDLYEAVEPRLTCPSDLQGGDFVSVINLSDGFSSTKSEGPLAMVADVDEAGRITILGKWARVKERTHVVAGIDATIRESYETYQSHYAKIAQLKPNRTPSVWVETEDVLCQNVVVEGDPAANLITRLNHEQRRRKQASQTDAPWFIPCLTCAGLGRVYRPVRNADGDYEMTGENCVCQSGSIELANGNYPCRDCGGTGRILSSEGRGSAWNPYAQRTIEAAPQCERCRGAGFLTLRGDQ